MKNKSTCPICGSEAQRMGTRDHGDKDAYDCERCRKYEISRTASAMLRNRLSSDPTSYARLSHAICARQKPNTNELFMVSSANLDELLLSPLPGPLQQAENLLHIVSAELGDDRLGYTRYRPYCWAGMVGVVSEEDIIALADYLLDKGLIKLLPEKGRQKGVPGRVVTDIGITVKGWTELNKQSTPQQNTGSKGSTASEDEPEGKPTGDVADSASQKEITKAHCPSCDLPELNCTVETSYRQTGYDEETEVSWTNDFDILQCCGCDTAFVRHTQWFSEWDTFERDPITGEEQIIPGCNVSYYPAALDRKLPPWVDTLEDEFLRDALNEVNNAFNSDNRILTVAGTRILVDRVIQLIVGDQGTFAAGLKQLLKTGHIGKPEHDILEITVDAGSASTHRNWKATPQVTATLLDIVENLINWKIHLKRESQAVKEVTPPREKPAK